MMEITDPLGQRLLVAIPMVSVGAYELARVGRPQQQEEEDDYTRSTGSIRPLRQTEWEWTTSFFASSVLDQWIMDLLFSFEVIKCMY